MEKQEKIKRTKIKRQEKARSMKIIKKTIRSSPYIGVFGTATEKCVLLPTTIHHKEEKGIREAFNAETIKTTIACSPLIGVLTIGNMNGFIASEIAEEKEIESLNALGIRIKKIDTVATIGNMVEVNDSRGICSNSLPKKTREEIEKFLKVELKTVQVSGTEVTGASIVLTNKGFIANPCISQKEFREIEKWTGLKGKTTTANMGDSFLGNSVIANSHGAAVGEFTTGYEIIRIDEGLNGT